MIPRQVITIINAPGYEERKKKKISQKALRSKQFNRVGDIRKQDIRLYYRKQ